MNNHAIITSDDVNIFILSEVRSSKKGLIALGIFNLFFLSGIIAITSLGIAEKDSFILIPFLFLTAFFVFFPLKYFLWNTYGKEDIIINTKSVSWVIDYGILRTNRKTVVFDQLEIIFEETGKLLFYNYNKHTNLPILFYESAITLTKTEMELINSKLEELFTNQFNNENGFFPFSTN